MASDDVSRIELLLREHFARTEKQLSDMRADNAEFRVQMVKDFNAFTEKIDARISKFEEKVDAKIEKLDNRISAFEERVDAKIEKLDDRISKFEEKVEARFEKVDARFEKVDARFERLEAKVVDMQNDMTGLKHDVGNLQTWNYWTLSIIIALLAMPQLIAGVKALWGAVIDIASLVSRVFRKEGKV